MSSMLEQAIIDAKELKEAAQKNAQEAVIEKYQSEIKEAVDKILEQEEMDFGGDMGMDPAADPAMGGDMGGDMGGEEEEPANQEQIDSLLEQIPFLQTTSEDEYIDLDLKHLEESLNIMSDEELLKELNAELKESIFFEEEDVMEEDYDPFGLEEDTLDEDLFDEDVQLDEDLFEEDDDRPTYDWPSLRADSERARAEAGAPRYERDPETGETLPISPTSYPEDYWGEEGLDEEIDLFDEDIFDSALEEVELEEDLFDEGNLEPVFVPHNPVPGSGAETDKGGYKKNPALEEDYELEEDNYESINLEEDNLDEDLDVFEEEIELEEDSEIYYETKRTQRKNKALLKERKLLNSKAQLLENKLSKYGTVINKLKNKLNESNLLNAKLLYQNRVLDSISLNERQKDKIVEAIQNTNSVEEAKIIFETLQSTVGSVKSKSRKAPESLNEVVTRSSSAFLPRKEEKRKDSGPFAERMKILAGLK